MKALKSICENNPCCGKNCKDWAILFLRIAVGVAFMYHGFGKLFGTPGIEGFSGMFANMNFPLPEFMAYLVGVVEFVGGIAIILGAYVQPFSILLAVIMAVAFIFVKKFNYSKGELDFVLFFNAIALAFAGSGKYSAVSGCKVCGTKEGSCCAKDNSCCSAEECSEKCECKCTEGEECKCEGGCKCSSK